MIAVGTQVRCKKEVRVTYGVTKPDDVVAAGSMGVVQYRPKDEDPGASFEIGVTWLRADATTCGIEVNECDVEVLTPLGCAAGIKRLFHYSWKDIGYDYEELTHREQAAISREQFADLVKWIMPAPGASVRARGNINVPEGQAGTFLRIGGLGRPVVDFGNDLILEVRWSQIDW